MTESTLQRAIFYVLAHDRDYSHVTPNVHLYGWESDVLGITPSGYVVEYEIKLSKSDFRRDLSKKRHKILTSFMRTASQNMRSGKRPSRFFYACPPGLISPDDVPPYAGLTYVRGRSLDGQRKAPRLTKSKARQSHRTRLARSLQWHAWSGWTTE